jgi:hypothetical protein
VPHDREPPALECPDPEDEDDDELPDDRELPELLLEDDDELECEELLLDELDPLDECPMPPPPPRPARAIVGTRVTARAARRRIVVGHSKPFADLN